MPSNLIDSLLLELKVLELKTALQKVRAANDRRTAKQMEHWVSRSASAAVERQEATERQKLFSRKLEKDVDDMEEKLAVLERQVRTTIELFDGKGEVAPGAVDGYSQVSRVGRICLPKVSIRGFVDVECLLPRQRPL